MFKNYLAVMLRNLRKQTFYSIINITGLAIGMTCCLLIWLYVQHELSYDQFHSKADRIYRVVTDIKTDTETINTDICAAPVGPNLESDFPEVLSYVRVAGSQGVMQYGEHQFQENELLVADSTFFSVFDFNLIKGNPAEVLKQPFTIVLTEETATRYFGEANPIGQSLRFDNQYDVKVTGIMQEVPHNSQLKFDMVLSLSTYTGSITPERDEQWGNFGFYTFLLLPEQHEAAALQDKFPDFMDRHIGDNMAGTDMQFSLFLEPFPDVYLHSDRGAPESGNIYNVYIFSVIAVFILILACVNFMNLSIARSVERAKEVGLRKVIGASKYQLAFQFLGEALLFSLTASLLAILLSQFLLSAFNELSGKVISESVWSNAQVWLAMLLIVPTVGLLAGIYPAIVLSGFEPVKVLKGRFISNSKGIVLRKVLVVFQFAVSLILIIGTIVVYQQLSYLREQPLGFQEKQTVILPFYGDDEVIRQVESIKRTFSQIEGVKEVSYSASAPSLGNAGAYTLVENTLGEMQASNMDLYSVDFDFLDQYQIQMVAGRKFSTSFSTDSTQAMLVNEAAVASLGYTTPEEIVGKRFSQWGREGEIIGVIKNFNYTSLQKAVSPLTIRISPESASIFSLSVGSDHLPATIAQVEEVWKQRIPQRPFDFFFLDEQFNEQYQAEERFGNLFLYFSGLAIFIACLGLLSLTSYMTNQRTKEIGVRKVLGASVTKIVYLLSRDYMGLIGIAFALSVPVAWYLMHQWLQEFAYQSALHWWIFILAGAMTVVIALLTISWQSIKAALTNPVDSLRSE